MGTVFKYDTNITRFYIVGWFVLNGVYYAFWSSLQEAVAVCRELVNVDARKDVFLTAANARRPVEDVHVFFCINAPDSVFPCRS